MELTEYVGTYLIWYTNSKGKPLSGLAFTIEQAKFLLGDNKGEITLKGEVVYTTLK